MTKSFVGIDLGGTTISAASAQVDGELLSQEKIATLSETGPEEVLERIVALVKRLTSSNGETPVAIGIGVPGLVDVASGVSKFLPNMPTHWRDVAVSEFLSNRLGCPVFVMNDVRVATLGELRFGHGKDQPNLTMAFFSLGTGVGGGVVIDGKLRLGPVGAAGEIGHQTIIPDGPQCGCGNRGCLETIASGPAIAAEGIRLMRMGLAPSLHNLVGGNADRVTTKEMSTAASNDVRIQGAILSAANYLGIAAANLVTVLHPDLIVLGGGVSKIGETLTSTVREVVADRVRMFPTSNVRVEQSKMGDQAGVMGAIALAIENSA